MSNSLLSRKYLILTQTPQAYAEHASLTRVTVRMAARAKRLANSA